MTEIGSTFLHFLNPISTVMIQFQKSQGGVSFGLRVRDSNRPARRQFVLRTNHSTTAQQRLVWKGLGPRGCSQGSQVGHQSKDGLEIIWRIFDLIPFDFTGFAFLNDKDFFGFFGTNFILKDDQDLGQFWFSLILHSLGSGSYHSRTRTEPEPN